VDDQRLGAAVRAVRIRRRLRQADVARLAGVSQTTVSRIERGHLGPLSFNAVRAVASALDIRVDVRPLWRAGDLDRLLNARHSRFHESVARRLAAAPGWTIRPEVSFAIWGERGVVDVLGYHAARQMLLVIELKTDIVDVNELIGTLDRKQRLARKIAHSVGWTVAPSARVSAWIIVADGRTNRRRLDAHRAMLRTAFPVDGRTIGGWLVDPVIPAHALSIWPSSHGGTVGLDLAARRRVVARQSSVAPARSAGIGRPTRPDAGRRVRG
jgi:transcriptional regulator with XRE-family HTH domain